MTAPPQTSGRLVAAEAAVVRVCKASYNTSVGIPHSANRHCLGRPLEDAKLEEMKFLSLNARMIEEPASGVWS